MVQIPIIQQTTGVGFTAAPRAEALPGNTYMNDATAKLGAAVGEIGTAVQKRTDEANAQALKDKQVLAHQEEQSGKLYAGNTVSDAFASIGPNYEEFKAQMKPGEQTLVPYIQKSVKDYFEQAAQNAPTPVAANFIAQHGQSFLQTFTQKALTDQTQANLAYRSNQFSKQADTWANTVTADPKQVDMALKTLDETMPALDPEAQVRLREAARTKILTAAAIGEIQRNPGGSYDALSRGLGGAGRPNPAAAGAPGTGVPSASTALAPVTGPDTRGERNNNFGNIRKSDIKWQGEIPGQDPEFVTFANPEAGVRGTAKNLLAYYDKHGRQNVQQIISAWAPSSENNTGAYIAAVSKQLGVKPDEALNLKDPKVLKDLTTAIIQHENGRVRLSDGQIKAGVDSALNGGAVSSPASIADLRAKPEEFNQADWGKRPDGTAKGQGYLGVLKRPDGQVMTEYSVGVSIGGKEMDIPTLVPTLTKAEVNTLLTIKDGDKLPDAIVNKAADYAKTRLAAGKPVFAQEGEQADLQQSRAPAAPADPNAAPPPTGNAVFDKLPVELRFHFLGIAHTAAQQTNTAASAQFKAQVQDATAAARNGDVANLPKFTDAQWAQAYGPTWLGAKKDYEVAQQFGQDKRALDTQSTQQISATLAARDPTGTPVDETYQSRLLTFQGLKATAAQVIDTRNKDGASWAMQNVTDVQGAYQAFKALPPTATTEERAAAFQKYATLTIGQQQVVGIPNPKLFAPDQLKALALDLYQAKDPQEWAQKLHTNYATWGNLTPKVMAEMGAPLIKVLGSKLDNASVPQQLQYFTALRQNFLGDDAGYNQVMQLFAHDSPVKARAGDIAVQPNAMTLSTSMFGNTQVPSAKVAETLLTGENIINKTKAQKDGDGNTKSLFLPPTALLNAAFVNAAGDVFRNRAGSQETDLQVATAYYVGKAAQLGRLTKDNKDIDGALVREALGASIGQIYNVNGQGSVTLPPTVSAGQFGSDAHTQFRSAVKAAGLPDAVADQWPNYGLINYRQTGQYAVTLGGVPVVDKDRRPVVITVGAPRNPLIDQIPIPGGSLDRLRNAPPAR